MPTLPSTPSVPAVPSVSTPKAPKLPTVPTKIDVKNGTGVPGGFSGDNVKTPDKELSKISEAKLANAAEMAKVSSAEAKLNSLSKQGDPNKLAPGASSKIASAKGKLSNQMSALNKKSSDIKKSAVDYSNPVKVPKPPALPKIPTPKIDLPDIPSTPNLPSTPSLPSI